MATYDRSGNICPLDLKVGETYRDSGNGVTFTVAALVEHPVQIDVTDTDGNTFRYGGLYRGLRPVEPTPEPETVVCPDCDGDGFVLTGKLDENEDAEYEDCGRCEGYGAQLDAQPEPEPETKRTITASAIAKMLTEAGLVEHWTVADTGGGVQTMVVGPFEVEFSPYWNEHGRYGAAQIGPGARNEHGETEFDFAELSVAYDIDPEAGRYVSDVDELVDVIKRRVAVTALRRFAYRIVEAWDSGREYTEHDGTYTDVISAATGVPMDDFDLGGFAENLLAVKGHSIESMFEAADQWAVDTHTAIVEARQTVRRAELERVQRDLTASIADLLQEPATAERGRHLRNLRASRQRVYRELYKLAVAGLPIEEPDDAEPDLSDIIESIADRPPKRRPIVPDEQAEWDELDTIGQEAAVAGLAVDEPDELAVDAHDAGPDELDLSDIDRQIEIDTARIAEQLARLGDNARALAGTVESGGRPALTVADMIEALSQLPPDVHVVTTVDGRWYRNVDVVAAPDPDDGIYTAVLRQGGVYDTRSAL